MLQSEAGYIDARPHHYLDKTSCNARPDHTWGHTEPSARPPGTAAMPPILTVIGDIRGRLCRATTRRKQVQQCSHRWSVVSGFLGEVRCRPSVRGVILSLSSRSALEVFG